MQNLCKPSIQHFTHGELPLSFSWLDIFGWWTTLSDMCKGSATPLRPKHCQPSNDTHSVELPCQYTEGSGRCYFSFFGHGVRDTLHKLPEPSLMFYTNHYTTSRMCCHTVMPHAKPSYGQYFRLLQLSWNKLAEPSALPHQNHPFLWCIITVQ